jgi:hypothetical protein
MKQLHLFTIKVQEIAAVLNGVALYTVFGRPPEYFKTPEEEEADAWIASNDIGNFVKTPYIEHKGEKGVWGFELPTWAFYNELDALQFKLVFGDKFEYSIYDTEDE